MMMAAKHEKLFSIERRAQKPGAPGVLKSANTDILPATLAEGGVELLNGPALGVQGLSQADIDALFD